MLTDNTKIPFGYGGVRIEFNKDYLYFKTSIDHDQWIEEEEVIDEFTNLDVEEVIEKVGVHFSFDLHLIDRDMENQNNIAKFWYYYNVNPNTDKSFKIFPMYSIGLMSKRWKKRLEFEVVLNKRSFSNISNKKRNGEILHLELKTKKMIPALLYNTIIYRERNGDWGILGFNETVTGGLINSTDGGIDGLFGYNWYWNDDNYQRFRPFSDKSYQIFYCAIYVLVANPGITLDIGTSQGGHEVAETIDISTIGWKHFEISKEMVESGNYMYATPSVGISDNDIKIFYKVS